MSKQYLIISSDIIGEVGETITLKEANEKMIAQGCGECLSVYGRCIVDDDTGEIYATEAK